jgi:hypothetical protein
MIGDLISQRYALSAPSLAVFGVSLGLSIVLILAYCRMHKQRRWDKKLEKRHQSSNKATTSPRAAGSASAATPRSSLLNIQGASDPNQQALLSRSPGADYQSAAQTRKVRREHPSATHDDWGDAVQCYGVDLGSYSIKAHLMSKDQKLIELPPKRSLCTLLEEGVSFGDVEIALESAGTSFFSLTRDLCDPESTVTYGDVSMRPYQAIAGVFLAIVGDRPLMPPVAVCVPPYLQQVAQHLYLSAVSGNLARFFIFSHSAALIAALLRHRQLSKQKSKPPHNVVFVDLGRSGVAAYVCEVRELSGSVRFQSFRCAGIQNMEARLVLELSSALDEKDSTTMARVIEVAREIREDFASVPEYLAKSKKKSSATIPTINGDTTLELSREVFDQICELATADLEEVMEEVQQYLQSGSPGGSAAGHGDSTELVLVGKAFNHRPFRAIFEQHFDRRLTSFDKISVSEGLAILGVMENPKFTGQRFDVYPLFQLPTVDEMGTRKFQDSQRALVSAQKNSSQLARSKVSRSTLARE